MRRSAKHGTACRCHSRLLLRFATHRVRYIVVKTNSESIDVEKKKYFKIQASSAGPASTAYSSQDVKRRETRDRLAETKKLKLARQKGRIRGSRVLESPLAGDVLEREHGRRRDIDTAKIFATGLKPLGRLSSLVDTYDCDNPLFHIDHRPELGSSVADLSIGTLVSQYSCTAVDVLRGSERDDLVISGFRDMAI